MRISNYFMPILKEDPTDAKIVSHKLMLRAGLIRQLSSGLYSWLPNGLKTLHNIENIVRNSMDKYGAIELLMPCIQPAKLWEESGRHDDYGKEMLRIRDRHDNDLLFGPTNEEAITDIFRGDVKSYKELPLNLYHIQWKFRDEIRPRFGVMRGREFLMKDAYSFDIDSIAAKKSYDNMFCAYLDCFKTLGLKVIPVRATTGAIGGDLSHEFHIVAPDGESTIYYDARIDGILANDKVDVEELKTLYAAADEKHDPNNSSLSHIELKTVNGIEVGHIFNFGTKYTKAMNVVINDQNGKLIHPEMGSYGIGISRLVAAIIESSHDDKGIIWPESVTPFKVSLINLNIKDEVSTQLADSLYNQLRLKNIDTLYDDTSAGAGSKFATHDLLGFPWQIIVGPKLASLNLVELKDRRTGERIEIKSTEIIQKLQESLGDKCH